MKEKYDLQKAACRLNYLKFKQWKMNGKKGPKPPLKLEKSIYMTKGPDGQIKYRYKEVKLHQVKLEYAFHLSKAPLPGIAAVTELSTEDAFLIIWDSGASVCITFDKKDFIDFSSDSELTTLKGFLQREGQGVKGSGTVKWFIQDENGQSREIRIRAYQQDSPSEHYHLVESI